MDTGIAAKIASGESEEGGCRLKPPFLQMNECSGELNQALVEESVRFMPPRQPYFLQNFVCFKKKLLVETIEKGQIMRVQFLAAKPLNYPRDFFVFLAHGFTLKGERETPKRFVEADSLPGVRLTPRAKSLTWAI